MVGLAGALRALAVVEPVLLEPAATPRWDLVVGFALAVGFGVAVAVYLGLTIHGLLAQSEPAGLVPIVAAAFLVGGVGGYLVAVDQPFAREYTSTGPCSLGPWTASWRSSQDVFDRLPANGSRGSFSIDRFEPGDGWPSAPPNAPESWGPAAITGVHWVPPADRLGEWSNASASVTAEPDEDKLRFFVRLEGQGVQDTARELAVEVFQRATNVSQASIEQWTEPLGGDERVDGPLVERVYPNATLDVTDLVDDLDRDGWTVTRGPPIGPSPSAVEIHQGKGNWTVRTLVPVTLAEGEVEGTAVRFAVSATDHVALHVDETTPLSDEAWARLASAVYEQLGIDPAPERDWRPGASADC